MPDLVILFGPPASGKAAIGVALAKLTGYRLWHNHMTADAVAALFGWESEAYRQVAAEVRLLLLKKALELQVEPGIIFTFVWALELEDDNRFIDDIVAQYTLHGHHVTFVELLATRRAREKREGSALRLSLKPAKRDVRSARELHARVDAQHTMNSDGQFPYPDRHVVIDTEAMKPEQAAMEIARRFNLPARNARYAG
ncbi:MAG: hypothetical protein HY854_04480 [Burkholderiales bacterium]|nr:hypothetical protein [Burkholderiales bacterium]